MSVLHVGKVQLLTIHTNVGSGASGDPVYRVITLLDPKSGRTFQLREGLNDHVEPLKTLCHLIMNAEVIEP